MMTETVNLQNLPGLAELFKWFNAGKHLNRLSEPVLWVELEQSLLAYQAIFQALGYELRVDGRGFAWFHNDEVSASVTGQSRQLALLFMVIFDTQADAGHALQRFSEWRVDRKFIEAVFDQHRDLLDTEGLQVEALIALLTKAETFGLVRQQGDFWELLPAVCRYLDHFEALAGYLREHHSELDSYDLDSYDKGDDLETGAEQ